MSLASAVRGCFDGSASSSGRAPRGGPNAMYDPRQTCGRWGLVPREVWLTRGSGRPRKEGAHYQVLRDGTHGTTNIGRVKWTTKKGPEKMARLRPPKCIRWERQTNESEVSHRSGRAQGLVPICPILPDVIAGITRAKPRAADGDRAEDHSRLRQGLERQGQEARCETEKRFWQAQKPLLLFSEPE